MSGQQNTSSNSTRRFDDKLNENVNDFHLPENQWTQARNAINNSVSGDLGKLGNEPGNLFCTQAPYTIIGVIHLTADIWAIYSTDDTNSEIGIFNEELCQYDTAVNDPCLNFRKSNLIKGASRLTSTCRYNLYWDDGRNPSRGMSVFTDTPADNAYTNPNSPIPWIQTCNIVDSCNICTNTSQLDCDAIRLARFIKLPCIKVLKGVGAGTLLNGSYMVAVAYAINNQKISDWIVSNVQGVFDHNNAASSIDVVLSDVDQDFDQLLVALISVTNQQTVARLAGTYNTRQKQLSFDTIDNTWPVIAIEEIPIMNPVADKTDAMYNVNDYLIRVGPTSKEDFNYQPLANQIVTKWQSVEYPTDYYRKGGNNTNYLRDEVYPFFIRWVYDTGDKSASYHIPGRPGGNFWTNPFTGILENDFLPVANNDSSPECEAGLSAFNWNVYNTATNNPFVPIDLPDGGKVIGEGLMGYWESTEIYPDDKPQIWNAGQTSSPYSTYGSLTNDFGVLLPNPGTAHDLCGKKIRHHKFPDLVTGLATQYTDNSDSFIRIMGVKFENIKAPMMNDGITPVPGIVGYEILRGTRNGNKTILAKGLINNMKVYDIPNGTTTRLGAYPNYPYNEVGPDIPFQPLAPAVFFGRPDPFLSTTKVSWDKCPLLSGASGGENGYSAQLRYSKFLFTFHSPDTNFTDPFLSAKELKIHGEFNGDVVGKFEKSEEHPKEKLLTNTAFTLAAIAGTGLAALAMNGQRTVNYKPPRTPGYSQDVMPQIIAGTTAPGIPGTPGFGAQPAVLDIPFIIFNQGLINSANTGYNFAYDANLIANLAGFGTSPAYSALQFAYNGVSLTDLSFSSTGTEFVQNDGAYDRIPSLLRSFPFNLPVFFNYFTQGTDTALDFFKAVIRYRDFALRYHSHCYYNRYVNPRLNQTRRVINQQEYIGPQITDFGLGVRINNLYRAKTVAIELASTSAVGCTHTFLENTQVNDITRIIASQVDNLRDTDVLLNPFPKLVDPSKEAFGQGATYSSITPGNASVFYPGHSGIQIASSHYASLKQRIRNQYGQINGVIQVPTASCVMDAPSQDQPTESDVIFGGDTYMGRYTEKNTFFFFYNWLYGQPDGAQFDYTKNEMIPYPRFWANFDQFETGDFTSSIASGIIGAITGGGAGIILPNDFYNLDGLECNLGFFSNMKLSIRYAWFYLFSSGVKDFYVESEINVDLRDWGALETEQHYDPYRYSDTKALFDTKIIKSTNYYKYDQSLSIAKLFINYTSWSTVQQNNYDPFIAETCFIYSPNKLIYSLPAQFEGTRDNWYIFLPNNYTSFLSRVTCIKSIGKSGALIFFETDSPVQFQGLDQLQTTSGVKLVIGDGGLFNTPPQNIVNADRPYEYASCQDRLSVINTPAGVFFMNQNQGKIFHYQGGLIELSMQDLKWWFVTYLPYQLTKQFPNFELTDNPVIGIGCQSIYDNENSLVYFTKRDFVVRKDLPAGTTVEYVSSDNFNLLIDGIFQFAIKLGDLAYFEDASWTISYDPKTKGWLSYHDWHPNLIIPGKNTFLTIKDNGLWIHNLRADLYCNYYGVDYPFEVEYMVNTIQQVNTLRSIEYILEVYKYDTNDYDRFHVLDFNFDEAVVYNTEQVSGLLKLNLAPKNDPQAELLYPAINFADIDILFNKVENKYRFNMFWDITADRGEFNPAAQRMIWNTAANGYVRVLNPNNLNYNKDEFQRKKFRHYTNTILLRRLVSGDRKMMVLLTQNKNLLSPR